MPFLSRQLFTLPVAHWFDQLFTYLFGYTMIDTLAALLLLLKSVSSFPTLAVLAMRGWWDFIVW